MKSATKKQPRGIRNNNPLNIRIGNTWLGEVPNPTDCDFEQFVSVEYGLRAAFVILRRYIRRYGRNTMRKIISAWAPSNENNTAKYIEVVAQLSGIDPDELIDFGHMETMCKLVEAMAVVENGQPISHESVVNGYLKA